jgi:hypothetical protein
MEEREYESVRQMRGHEPGPLRESGGVRTRAIRARSSELKTCRGIEISAFDRVPEYIKRVKTGEFRLMGFGHRLYKNYDPRADH